MKTKKEYPVNDRIIEKMQEAGMDESALAMASGLAVQTVYNIANKLVRPNRSTIESIAKGLKANFLYLYTGTEGELPGQASDPMRDFLIQELKKEAEDWKKEYQWIKGLLNDLRGGITLGKFRPVKGTAQRAAA